MVRSEVAAPSRAAANPSFLAVAMRKTDRRTTNGPGKPGLGQEHEGVDDAFDLWLQRGLHQLYDQVAKEPLPPDLLRLIVDDRTSRGNRKP